MKSIAALLSSCVIACAGANAARARDAASPVTDYQAVFQQCLDSAKSVQLAIRVFSRNGEAALLLADPQTLATRVALARDWACVETDDAAQAATRYIRAVDKPAPAPKPGRAYLQNAGLAHGQGDGAFITGDLCPSLRPLDRGFIEELKALGPHTPVALSITGVWLNHHLQDFQWLRETARAGDIDITWVNHSFHHPYAPNVPFEQTFLLAPGVDIQAEIFETEKLLIAHGETPSVFFRFPGLISNPALMDEVRRDHLIALGADAWLALAPGAPRPGAIVLVHPNGNEPAGLKQFTHLLAGANPPRPFRAINDAPSN